MLSPHHCVVKAASLRDELREADKQIKAECGTDASLFSLAETKVGFS